jgi:hypothetical protein
MKTKKNDRRLWNARIAQQWFERRNLWMAPLTVLLGSVIFRWAGFLALVSLGDDVIMEDSPWLSGWLGILYVIRVANVTVVTKVTWGYLTQLYPHLEFRVLGARYCQILAKIGLYGQIWGKLSSIKFHEDPLSNSVVTCKETDCEVRLS